MNAHKTILTCAVTGGDDVAHKYRQLPVSPKEIAQAVCDAESAGAAIAHIHVRDPDTGKPSMNLELYREVMERVQAAGSEIIINLTTGPGARYVPSLDERNVVASGSNVQPPMERVKHVLELRPEICTLDMGSLNFGKGVLVNVPDQIRAILGVIKKSNTLVELEIFDTGHMALTQSMLAEGLLSQNSIFQFALGVPWGAPATSEILTYYMSTLPKDAIWAAFGVGRAEFPVVAKSFLLGGHIRVGMEDNFYLAKGVTAENNGQLVEKAVGIVETLGGQIASPDEARKILGLSE